MPHKYYFGRPNIFFYNFIVRDFVFVVTQDLYSQFYVHILSILCTYLFTSYMFNTLNTTDPL